MYGTYRCINFSSFDEQMKSVCNNNWLIKSELIALFNKLLMEAGNALQCMRNHVETYMQEPMG
jgi:hypothetical protein